MGNRLGRLGIAMILLCALFCLAGCGESESSADSVANTDAEFEEAESVIDRSDFEWRTSEWKRTNSKGIGEVLYIGEFVEGIQHKIGFDYVSWDWLATRSYESIICRLDYFVLEDGEYRYVMNRYDWDTGEISYTEIDLDSLLGGENTGQIPSFDIYGEEEYVFLRAVYEEGHDFKLGGWKEDDDELCGLAAVHTDLAGNILRVVDLYPGIVESEYLSDRGWGQWQELYVDMQGNYYFKSTVSGEKLRKMAILDSDGCVLCVVDPYPKGSEKAKRWSNSKNIEYMMRDPDGTPIFGLEAPDQSETLVFAFDPQRKEMRQMSLIYFDPSGMESCMTEEGMLYFLSSGDGCLYRWDLFTGGILTLMNCVAEDITRNIGYLKLIRDSADRLILYEMDDVASVSAYILTEEKPASEGNMRIVSLNPDCMELRASTADYSRKYRQNGITVEYNAEDPKAYRDRLMADLVAGKGPDAMYVSREDMETLYEKGLLEDLTGVLPYETSEQIFPGVLECGRIEGRQIGFALEVQLQTMMVSQDVWEGDSWSLEDVLALLEKDEIRSNLEELVASRTGPFGANGMFRHLVMQDIENSPFVDLENHACSFDSEEFIRILELCKQYCSVVVGEEAVSLVQEGKALAYVDGFSSINIYSHSIYDLGMDFHCVGYPTESGSGSFWRGDYFLVVRKDADCMDTLKGYVEYMYSVSRQRKQDTPLNREVYDRYIVQDNNIPGYEYLDTGYRNYIPIRYKRDGSSCVEDFLKLAEKSVPSFRSDEGIAEIVLEEVDSFFAGDKDAATVAGIIQNRVKLYLAENS